MQNIQTHSLVELKTALQRIENWRDLGRVTTQNQVAYFAFDKMDLLALLNQPKASGIRFHFGFDPSTEKISLLASGVRLLNGKTKTLLNQFCEAISKRLW